MLQSVNTICMFGLYYAYCVYYYIYYNIYVYTNIHNTLRYIILTIYTYYIHLIIYKLYTHTLYIPYTTLNTIGI